MGSRETRRGGEASAAKAPVESGESSSGGETKVSGESESRASLLPTPQAERSDAPPHSPERSGATRPERPKGATLRRAAELAEAELPFAVVTVVRTEPATSARVGNRAIVFPDGTMEGWIGGGCIQPTARNEGLAALEEGEPRLVRITADTDATQPNVRLARMTCASEGTADLYVEPFPPRPTLVVAGNSPTADTLAAIAPPLGFRFVRMEAGAKLDEAIIPNPRDTWMVVATFGEFDEEAIEAGIKLGLLYIGLVASERRAGSVISELRARGRDEDDLKSVRSPAGLPIGAGGREAIPISIMAEVFSMRSARRSGTTGEVRPEEATDPICGMSVEVATARHTSEHDGETYYFCCAGCKRAFDGPLPSVAPGVGR
ncbi:MAG: XdhC family protein [Rubrobacteraceae bacterium]